MELIKQNEYLDFLRDIKEKISSARIKVSKSVHRGQIQLYWDIGKTIIERQEQHGWGKSIVEKLAKDLSGENKCNTGFSPQNLWYMRQFFLEYKDAINLQQLVGEIPWGQNIIIMSRVKRREEREYYLKSCTKFGWSRNVLLNQIKADAYHLAIKKPRKDNFEKVLPEHLAEQADEAIKDVCVLDFLGITKPVLERELENRLVQKIKEFILELGIGFAFIGNQYKVILDGDEYFIDLLFFNRKLKCLVAVELKTGKFEPEYAGKMDFYLHLLNEQAKMPDENPPIGLILCADKKDVLVEYALRSVKNPVGVTEYQLTSKLTKKLKNALPDVKLLKEKIEQELA